VRVLFLFLLISSPSFAQDVAAKAGEYMDATASVNHFNGNVLAAQDGKVVFVHSYGIADTEKNLPNVVNTKFRTGSITKVFTAAAVLMHRDEGKLKLDDSVCLYLNGCPEAWHAVTIRQLLTHDSGITDDFAALTQMRREHKSPAEFIEAINKRPLESVPGTRNRYSNSGYIVIGGVISKTSGLSYAAFLRKRIFEPLQLKNTDAETAPATGEAVGYSWDGTSYRKAEALDVSGVSSAAMVCSTVGDLLRFVEGLRSGKLLKARTVAEMWANYAWRIQDWHGRRLLAHGGDIEGFASEIDDYPDQRVVIISLSNIGGTSPAKLHGDLAAIIFGEPYTIPHERHFVELSQDKIKALIGTYRLASGGTISVSASDRQLMLAPGGGQPVECKLESPLVCFLQPIDDDVTFLTDSSGKVTGIRMGNQMQGVKQAPTD
jgi:CubicO group peptidase (beta-lactamase class C family)